MRKEPGCGEEGAALSRDQLNTLAHADGAE